MGKAVVTEQKHSWILFPATQRATLRRVEIYKNYLRMTPENFNEILVLIRDDITKKDTPNV